MGLPIMLAAMNEPTQHNTPSQHHHPTYQICLKGHLDSTWSEWFDGMIIANQPDGHCTLTGLVVDQAALHGLLIKIRDLGLTLIEVKSIYD